MLRPNTLISILIMKGNALTNRAIATSLSSRRCSHSGVIALSTYNKISAEHVAVSHMSKLRSINTIMGRCVYLC